MKSALDWLMGKTATVSENGEAVVSPIQLKINAEPEAQNSDNDSFINGHFSESILGLNREVGYTHTLERPRRPSGEESRSPWGRTLTPKSPEFVADRRNKYTESASPARASNFMSLRMKSPKSWEEMSFASEVSSPGFTARIVREGRNRKLYDGLRKYPIGQEKFIRTGILPNVRLKGQVKPVVKARRAPTSPLLPLASTSSSFSSTLTSGFLSSASTRMPDISSVVSVLESSPSTSSNEPIKDPTSVQAVVAALEQAQNIKSGVKRSRYVDADLFDSNKKQKCITTSSGQANAVYSNSVSSPNCFVSAVGGVGEKRALDVSPPNNSEVFEKSQLSPENKRRCIPDPRIASLSSSKNIRHNLNSLSIGRESPFSMYESQQDSDSESNKSLDSHQSRHSERSYREQNHDLCTGRLSNNDQFDRSGSQTPQSLRGSFCVSGISNGSSSSSRTTTPSRPSHVFSLEAYKADKAKSQQRLNRMLGMLFNITDEEVQASVMSAKSAVAEADTSLQTPSSTAAPTTWTSLIDVQSKADPLKVIESLTPEEQSSKKESQSDSDDNNNKGDVSATYTLTLKSPPSSAAPDSAKTNEEQLPKATSLVIPTVCDVPSTVSSSDNATSGGMTLTELLGKGQTLTNIVFPFTLPSVNELQKNISSEPSTVSTVNTSEFPVSNQFSLPSNISSSGAGKDIQANNSLITVDTGNQNSAVKDVPSISIDFASKEPSNSLFGNLVTKSAPSQFSFGSNDLLMSSKSSSLTVPSDGFQFNVSNSALNTSGLFTAERTTASPKTSQSVTPSFSFDSKDPMGSSNNDVAKNMPIMSGKIVDLAPSSSSGVTNIFTNGSVQGTGNSVVNSETSIPSSAVVIPNLSTVVPSLPVFSFGTSHTDKTIGTGTSTTAKTYLTMSTGASTFPSIVSPSSNVTSGAFPFNTSAESNLEKSSSGNIQAPVLPFGHAEKSTSTFSSALFPFGPAISTPASNLASTFPFGLTSNPPVTTSAPFIFGPTKSTAPTTSSSFTFGSTKPSMPAAVSTTSPSFTFGSTKPVMSTVSTTSSSFTFGSTKPVMSTVSTTSSSFNFGSAKPAMSAVSITSPSFTYGSTKPTMSVASMFTFGPVSTTSASKSPFTFGSDNATTVVSPSFTFNADASTSSAPVFGSSGGGFTFTPKTAPSEKNLTATTTTSTAGFTFGSNVISSASTSANSKSAAAAPNSSNIFSFGNATSSDVGFGAAVTVPSTASFSFGSQQPSGSASSFGGAMSFGSSSTAPSVTSPFGSTPQSSTLFNGSKTDNTAFGSNMSSAPAFGSGSATFGASHNASALAFGSPPNPLLGSSATSTFGGTPFGSSPPSFGASNAAALTFGSPATPIFGSSATPAFGSSGTPTFGAQQTSSSSAFNFGQASSNTGQNIFQFGSPAPGNTPSFTAGSFLSGSTPNIFSTGTVTPGDNSASVSRRPRAKAYRRR